MEDQSLQESPKLSSSIVIPEDFESQKEMVRRVMNVLQQIVLQIDFTLAQSDFQIRICSLPTSLSSIDVLFTGGVYPWSFGSVGD